MAREGEDPVDVLAARASLVLAEGTVGAEQPRVGRAEGDGEALRAASPVG